MVICKSSAYKEILASSVEPQIQRSLCSKSWVVNIPSNQQRHWREESDDCISFLKDCNKYYCLLAIFLSWLLYFKIKTLDTYKLACPMGKSIYLISSVKKIKVQKHWDDFRRRSTQNLHLHSNLDLRPYPHLDLHPHPHPHPEKLMGLNFELLWKASLMLLRKAWDLSQGIKLNV